MEEITLYKFQIEHIKETLRVVSNILNSETKKTCIDRDVVQAKGYIQNALDGDITKQVRRF